MHTSLSQTNKILSSIYGRLNSIRALATDRETTSLLDDTGELVGDLEDATFSTFLTIDSFVNQLISLTHLNNEIIQKFNLILVHVTLVDQEMIDWFESLNINYTSTKISDDNYIVVIPKFNHVVFKLKWHERIKT